MNFCKWFTNLFMSNKPTFLFTKPKRKVDRIFIHCSDSDILAHDDISVIRKWHVEDRKWSDVGYHFFITKDGLIQEGRSLENIPAAQAGHNKNTIAICVSGAANFTPVSLRKLKGLCDAINTEYDGKVTFHGHREVSAKTCPVFNYKEVLGLDDKGYMNG